MKIAHLSVVHSVHDTRIYHKECKSLSNAGHEVFLVIPHDKKEIAEGVSIIPLKQFKKTIYRTYLNLPLVLFKSIKLNADVYHLHDPELIPVGVILKLFHKKIVYDIHEDYEVMPKRKFFRILFGIYEKFAMGIFDKFIAVTSNIANRFPKDKTIILYNYHVLSLIDKNIKNSNKINIDKNKLVLIYQGGLTRNRGIKELISAVGILNNKVNLILLGRWEKGFQEECQNLPGWNNVTYFGFKNVSEVYHYTLSSDIGLATLYYRPNYLVALPVKVFEYMAFSIPSIISDFPYWKEIFADSALFVNPKNPEDIADKIKILIEDKKLREKLGKKGRELVETKYNWEKEAEKLIKLYKDLS